MNQTLAIFLDAYRELNARKLFWITLIISASVIGVFALVGVKPDALTLLGMRMPTTMSAFVYKTIFDWVVLWFWLSIAATILALVSTGGIFPDFLTGGSVDLYLSKPIGRLRLFLTKYLAGLLFVVLQVSLFAAGSYLVLGLRGGVWKPGLFMAIPLVVCFFSYLFAVCVLLGVLTRSTIASLLLTVLIWAAVYGLHKSESFTLWLQTIFEHQTTRYQHQLADARAQLAKLQAEPPESAELAESRRVFQQRRLDKAREVLDQSEPGARKMATAHRIIYYVMTVLPKTSETTDMLDRWLYSDEELAEKNSQDQQNAQFAFGDSDQGGDIRSMQEANESHALALRHRSPVWIIGTSLAFEAVLVAWAAWVFCRRDY